MLQEDVHQQYWLLSYCVCYSGISLISFKEKMHSLHLKAKFFDGEIEKASYLGNSWNIMNYLIGTSWEPKILQKLSFLEHLHTYKDVLNSHKRDTAMNFGLGRFLPTSR